MRGLAVAERACRFRLDEVVDAGAAAAELLLGRLDELELRNRAKQRARLGADALGVAEVACLLVGDTERQRVQLRRSAGDEQLGDVRDRQVEIRVLQVRAAAGGVRDDRLGARRSKRFGRATRLREPLLALAGVERERAAAVASTAPSPRSRTPRARAPRRGSPRRRGRSGRSRSEGRLAPGARRRAGVSTGGETGSRHGGASARSGLNGPGAGRRENGSSRRSRRGCGKTAKTARRRSRSRNGRGTCSSTCSRASSISWSYLTPDGHEVRQAMQPRQRSKCSATVRFSSIVPSRVACISQMRPRGESISSLKTT